MSAEGRKKNANATRSAKCFQLTQNDFEKAGDLLQYLRGLNPNYLVACKENAPTTGHLHMHCYVQFPNARRLSLKKLLGAHCEKTCGSTEANIEYIKKKGATVIAEEGTPRLNHVPTIGEAKQLAPAQLATLPLNYYNIVAKIQAEQAKEIDPADYHKEVEVFWIWGESGAGKTRYAVNEMLARKVKFNEIKFDGHFWHGVSETCSACLYDDWRDNHMKPTELINFIDYNRHVMNVKGGSVRNNYSLIFITSLQSPDSIYQNAPEESKKQWLRRISKEVFLEIKK